MGTSKGKGFIKIKMDYKTSFNIRLVGNDYYTAWDGDYNLSSFTATHVAIVFENVTSVTKLPSFENNMVFSAGKWDTVTEDNGTKFRLLLTLRQPGVYAGHGAYYDSNDNLMLTFGVPTNTLSGMTVVIDPGHGYGKSATTFDPGAIGEVVEQEVVLGISKKLASAFQDAGANVVRLKSESQFLLTKERPIYARQYGCDLYLSVHANKASGSAKGTEVYYFTSYSQPLASSISSSLSSYFTNNVYADGANKNRGAKYSYYHVTLQQDFPSVLIEVGFVDNIEDAMAMASSTHQKGIAKAIVNGVKSYLSRSSISYASDASTNVDAPESGGDSEETEETTTPAETAAPEETSAPEETTIPEDTALSSDIYSDTGVSDTSDSYSDPSWNVPPADTDTAVTSAPEPPPETTTTAGAWSEGIIPPV